MDDLIYDSYSIFFQILQMIAPDYVGDYCFLLTGYAFSCLFLIIVIWVLLSMVLAFARAIVGWFTKWGG